MLHSSGPSLVCTSADEDPTVTWDLAEDAATRKSVCVCVWCRPPCCFTECYHIWMFCCNMWQKWKQKKKILMKKNVMTKKKKVTGTLLHLLRQSVRVISFLFQTPLVYLASCLITALNRNCLFASVFFLHSPSLCAPSPASCSTLQQL